jgi:opacity protein-like surface antigen
MRKVLLFAVAVAAIMVPAALADAPAQSPAAYCKANPSLIGDGKTYKNFGACVSAQNAKEDANSTNAAKTCKAERASIGVAAFQAKYGTNKNKKTPFGRCVSKIANAKTAEQQAAQANAAARCRLPENAANIGAGKIWRNFGACVKAQSKTS